MRVAAHHARYSIDDYVKLEEYSNVKHEYLDGHILAMAGGTPEHGARAMRVGAALVAGLQGKPCTVYSSDVRIRVVATGLNTYPDVSVVCGPEQRDADDSLALVNPLLLVEVLSPNTEEYDRGEKLEHYRQVTTLREVVLVGHREASIEVWRRDDDGAWASAAFGRGQTVSLASVGCELEVDDVFQDMLRR
jgi:Uma2 family endonuclease